MHQFQLLLLPFIMGFFHHSFQRRNDQRQRCTQFMAHIGKETEFHLIDFFIPLRFTFHLLYPELIAFTAQHSIAGQKQCAYQ